MILPKTVHCSDVLGVLVFQTYGFLQAMESIFGSQ